MNTQETTKENVNKLIEFRQAVYENGMLARRDATFDLLDALILEGPVSSFAMLSQSHRFPGCFDHGDVFADLAPGGQ